MTWDRVYNLDLILGNPSAPRLWEWSQWNSVIPLLDPLIQATRGEPGVASTQFTGKTTVKFGRLGWNDKSHQKWTHGSPISALEGDSSQWQFLSTEIWAPSRATCGRENYPPDFFFFLRNEGYFVADGLSFNPLVLIAIAQDVPRVVAQHGKLAAKSIAERVDAKLRASKSRPWAMRSRAGLTTAHIADIAVTGLFKPGPVHKQEPTLAILQEVDWETPMHSS